jgi:predicted transcriptional regulator
MTRTQRLMTLIEARNPISFDEMHRGTGWRKTVLNRALLRLCRFGVVVRVNVANEPRRHYTPS